MKVPASAREPAAIRGADDSRALVTDGSAAADESFGATTPVGEVARLEVRRLLAAWLAHEPGARRGVDAEELHRLRVTARRLDATLGLFKPHLPASLVHARKIAKALLRALGAPRDLDVQLEGLAEYCRGRPAPERAALEPLKARLALERAEAHIRMVRVLDAEPARRWIGMLAAAAAEPVPATLEAPPAMGVAALMEEHVRRRFRRLRKAVRRLGGHSSMDDYHRVRRRAKQLRYALEAGAALYGKAADEMLRSLRRLQDGLGAHQDAYMARKHLIALASNPTNALPAATLFLMGQLAEHHSRVMAQARETLAKHWRKVRGRRWRTLRAKLGALNRDPRGGSEASVAAPVVSAPAATALIPLTGPAAPTAARPL